MKYGMRNPSVKRSVSAKTTGKLKRSAKRVVDPFYGKRGAGMIRNPKKSLYNKVYSKTTFSAFDSESSSNRCDNDFELENSATFVPPYSSKKYRLFGNIAIAFSIITILLGLLLLLVDLFAIVIVLIGAFLLCLGLYYRHVAKDIDRGKYADSSGLVDGNE